MRTKQRCVLLSQVVPYFLLPRLIHLVNRRGRNSAILDHSSAKVPEQITITLNPLHLVPVSKGYNTNRLLDSQDS